MDNVKNNPIIQTVVVARKRQQIVVTICFYTEQQRVFVDPRIFWWSREVWTETYSLHIPRKYIMMSLHQPH